MSAKARLTFYSSLVFTSTTIAAVFYMKDTDKDARRQGIGRDLIRRSNARLENELDQNRSIELKKQLENEELELKASKKS
jgi:ribosomal protein S18 acetylase RimI-like enzyme